MCRIQESFQFQDSNKVYCCPILKEIVRTLDINEVALYQFQLISGEI